jgi:hypothetical protein
MVEEGGLAWASLDATITANGDFCGIKAAQVLAPLRVTGAKVEWVDWIAILEVELKWVSW